MGRIRQEIIPVACTEKEKDAIRRKAEKEGKPVGQYMRELALPKSAPTG